jgi:hypothetical protein
MKGSLFFCFLLLFALPTANADINGTYKVSGSEREGGQTLSFGGTLRVRENSRGRFNLKLREEFPAPPLIFRVTFSKLLRENVRSQTVRYSGTNVTGTATFRRVRGSYTVNFSHLDTEFQARDTGSGSQ